MKKFAASYEDIISIENLLDAWGEFVKGKRMRKDVQEFQLRLMDNVLALHHDLERGTYQHGGYHAFNISDPKPRNIHKASVRDRLLHHALYRKLYWHFHFGFITDSYSCRMGKGTHKALHRFQQFSRAVSKNNTRTCWVLKCDIKKFFANIDHSILKNILARHILDEKTQDLLERVIDSFSTAPGKGLPLGNLTSQLLVNIYMNEFDQFVKHTLKVPSYIRYADDFVLLSYDRTHLVEEIRLIVPFLRERLKLALHPDKVFIKTLASGVDFLGWVHFPDHRVLRTATKRRMLKRIHETSTPHTIASYLGMLVHGNAHTLARRMLQ